MDGGAIAKEAQHAAATDVREGNGCASKTNRRDDAESTAAATESAAVAEWKAAGAHPGAEIDRRRRRRAASASASASAADGAVRATGFSTQAESRIAIDVRVRDPLERRRKRRRSRVAIEGIPGVEDERFAGARGAAVAQDARRKPAIVQRARGAAEEVDDGDTAAETFRAAAAADSAAANDEDVGRGETRHRRRQAPFAHQD